MSQKVSRKSAVNEEKEKRQSPVKEMKKKMAANAEKEKQAAEKAEKQTEKPVEKAADKTEKPAEKVEKDKPGEKADKSKSDKQEKIEKSDKSDKKDKGKEEQKKEPQPEKSKAESSKEDKSAKPEKSDAKKPEAAKPNQNGRDRAHNGVSDVTLGTNGTDDVLNGTVSADSEDDDAMLVIDDDNDHDYLFPELTYEDTSDGDCFELPTPENGPSRSLTRRSQVKPTRTPETPRPASDKQHDKDADDPKDKLLKLREEVPTTDRKLRSSNSPKPQDVKKPDAKSSPKKGDKEGLEKVEEGKEEEGKAEEEEIQVSVEVPANEGEEVRKTDTNFSKSRVKVSPYRRSMRIQDQTNTSLQANYTGNNTTMEMDITETSSFLEEAALDDSSYLRGLRAIRGRASYKPLKEITLRHVTANRSARSNTSLTSPAPAECPSRPTGTVVGRKRKPDCDDVEVGVEASEHAASKRMRVLERLAQPFRRVAAAAALPAAARRNAEIVGINTDLPLTAPVASADTFDPESLKPVAPLVPSPSPAPQEPVAIPLAHDEKDSKRCVIM